MNIYRILINDINEVYEASSKVNALEQYAKDAGYNNYTDLIHNFSDDELEVVEIQFDLSDDEWTETNESYESFFGSNNHCDAVASSWYHPNRNVKIVLLESSEFWYECNGHKHLLYNPSVYNGDIDFDATYKEEA